MSGFGYIAIGKVKPGDRSVCANGTIDKNFPTFRGGGTGIAVGYCNHPTAEEGA